MNEITVRESGATPKLALRHINQIVRDALRKLGEYWHAYFAPKHFTHRGATEYGYTPRKRWYELRKLRLHGWTYPLVFTGKTRDRVLGQANIKATAAKGEGRVRVILNAPTLNRMSKHSLIDMRAEMTTVTAAENNDLAIVARLGCTKAFQAIGDTTTKRIA